MSRHVRFVKMHGAGNDFVMLDGRRLRAAGVTLDRGRIARWCARRLGIGADGLIVVDADPAPDVDFRMTYYNSDGGEATMCGNGARCCFAFARAVGLAGERGRFRTAAGVMAGELAPEGVTVELPDPGPVRRDVPLATDHPFGTADLVDTGVPHLVIPVSSVEEVAVPRWGPPLRRDPALGPEGANVNWVQTGGPGGAVLIRTYERGVEAETLACGTGAAAAAVALVRRGLAESPVTLLTRAGYRLTIAVPAADGGRLRLTGPVATVYSGEVACDD